jgi:hypothetical protein
MSAIDSRTVARKVNSRLDASQPGLGVKLGAVTAFLSVVGLSMAACGGSLDSSGSIGSTTSFAPGRAPFSAALFVEAYCAGCHQPSYVAPSGRQVAIFSTNPAWQAPFQDSQWLAALDYATIVQWGAAIRCGVYPGSLPSACTSLAEVAPGFFSSAEKFPPLGTLASSGGYGSTPPPVCAFAADGHTCPQPSDDDRKQMVSWIDQGFPR